MTRDTQRRLQKLESQVPRQPTEQEKQQKNVQSFQMFLMCAIAYYLGDPTPEGSVEEAYRRALGYPHSMNFKRPGKPTIRILMRGIA
jgi:hypothetical protein